MKSIRKAAALLLAVVTVTLFASCFGKRMLVGTWSDSSEIFGVTVETSYTFRGDGTGKMTTVLGVNSDFTYEVSGSRLYITYSVLGIESTEVYEYKISGNSLYLTSDGETAKLTKQ